MEISAITSSRYYFNYYQLFVDAYLSPSNLRPLTIKLCTRTSNNTFIAVRPRVAHTQSHLLPRVGRPSTVCGGLLVGKPNGLCHDGEVLPTTDGTIPQRLAKQ